MSAPGTQGYQTKLRRSYEKRSRIKDLLEGLSSMTESLSQLQQQYTFNKQLGQMAQRQAQQMPGASAQNPQVGSYGGPIGPTPSGEPVRPYMSTLEMRPEDRPVAPPNFRGLNPQQAAALFELYQYQTDRGRRMDLAGAQAESYRSAADLARARAEDIRNPRPDPEAYADQLRTRKLEQDVAAGERESAQQEYADATGGALEAFFGKREGTDLTQRLIKHPGWKTVPAHSREKILERAREVEEQRVGNKRYWQGEAQKWSGERTRLRTHWRMASQAGKSASLSDIMEIMVARGMPVPDDPGKLSASQVAQLRSDLQNEITKGATHATAMHLDSTLRARAATGDIPKAVSKHGVAYLEKDTDGSYRAFWDSLNPSEQAMARDIEDLLLKMPGREDLWFTKKDAEGNTVKVTENVRALRREIVETILGRRLGSAGIQ